MFEPSRLRPLEEAIIRHVGHYTDCLPLETRIRYIKLLMIQSTLEATNGNQAAAARFLGINRTTLVELLSQFKRGAPLGSNGGSYGKRSHPKKTKRKNR